MSLSDIVNVQISSQSASPTVQNFGLPLAMGYHTVFPERARSYTGTDAMVTDGFATDAPLVRLVGKIFAQSPTVTRVVVGRSANAPVPTIKLEPQLAGYEASTSYSVVVSGEVATFATDATPAVIEITAALKIAIDALAIPGVTTVDNGTDLDVNGIAGTDLYIETDAAQFERLDGTPDPGVVADLLAIKDVNDDWFAVALAYESKAITLAMAAQIEQMSKKYSAQTGDDEVKDLLATTNIMAQLAGLGYAKTEIYFTEKPHLYINGAALGVELPLDPGTYTMKFKTLVGITASRLNDTEKANISAQFGNSYTTVGGLSIVVEGVTPSQSFIDLPRFSMWNKARMEERIFGRFVNLPKVGYTNTDIGIIEAEVKAQLQVGVDREALTSYTVTVKDVSEATAAERRARNVTLITWEAQYAGAVHSVDPLRGVITI